MRRVGSTLIPAGEIFEEDVRKIPEGADLLVKVSRPRSLPQMRLFWTLLSKIAKATQYDSPEKLLLVLKLTLGYADSVQLPSGKFVPVARSIAFHQMSSESFNAFFTDSIDLIATAILPDVRDDVLVDEIYAALGSKLTKVELGG